MLLVRTACILRVISWLGAKLHCNSSVSVIQTMALCIYTSARRSGKKQTNNNSIKNYHHVLRIVHISTVLFVRGEFKVLFCRGGNAATKESCAEY